MAELEFEPSSLATKPLLLPKDLPHCSETSLWQQWIVLTKGRYRLDPGYKFPWSKFIVQTYQMEAYTLTSWETCHERMCCLECPCPLALLATQINEPAFSPHELCTSMAMSFTNWIISIWELQAWGSVLGHRDINKEIAAMCPWLGSFCASVSLTMK